MTSVDVLDVAPQEGTAPDLPIGSHYEPVPHEAGASYHVPVRPSFKVRHERVSQGWAVYEAETGIFGHGPNLRVALADLRAALYEHRDVLRRQSVLSPELAAQLSYLRERLG